MRKSIVRLSILLLALTASCLGPEKAEEGERYVGERRLPTGEVQQVVALLLPKKNGFVLELSKTLASASAERWSFLQAGEAWTVDLGSELGAWGSLQFREGCATAQRQPEELELCRPKGEIHLKLTRSGRVLHQVDLASRQDLPASAERAQDRDFALDELLGRAKFHNYAVAQEAEKVFQARQAITVALGNLLPKASMDDLMGYAMNGPMALLGSVGNFLPFLFPGNWFKWQESRDMYEAERFSFASMRGNEMNGVELLYYSLLRDQALEDLLRRKLEWATRIQELIREREAFGLLPLGSTDRWNIELADLAQEVQDLHTLVTVEKASLAQAVALAPNGGIESIVAPALPDLASETEWDGAGGVDQAKSRSLELKATEALIRAAESATKEKVFGFLQPETMFPLGFGYAANIRVTKSEIRALKIKQEEIASLIERRAIEVAAEFNNALASHRLAENGARSAQRLYDRAMLELTSGQSLLGDPEFLDNLQKSVNALLTFEARRVSAAYLALAAQAKRDRLILKGFYENLDSLIPGVPEK